MQITYILCLTFKIVIIIVFFKVSMRIKWTNYVKGLKEYLTQYKHYLNITSYYYYKCTPFLLPWRRTDFSVSQKILKNLIHDRVRQIYGKEPIYLKGICDNSLYRERKNSRHFLNWACCMYPRELHCTMNHSKIGHISP